MSISQDLVEQLESAMANRDLGYRAAALRRLADLFVVRSGTLSGEQIELFDDVMERLIDEIETSARAAFGKLLAAIPDAPPRTLRRLALDDAIVVASPVLSQSPQLDDMTLLLGARTKSQDHLLAISCRSAIAETVTDVLVERGNRQVAFRTAANPGAAFSEFGYSTVVRRSSGDADLAAAVWARPEIPRLHLLRLFADASESVRQKLVRADPRRADLIQRAIAQAAKQIQAKVREKSPEHAAAMAAVQALRDSGKLDEAHLADFARAGKFDETAIALSFICDLSIGLIERALVQGEAERIIVLAKAAGISWETTKAILLLQPGTAGGSMHELDRCFATYVQLTPDTARKAVQYFRLRVRAAVLPAN